MTVQSTVSDERYSLGDRLGGIFPGMILTGLLVGGPASAGALAGGALGFGAAAVEVVTHLNSYHSLPEAVAAAETWTTTASYITGTIGAIIGAKKALEHPWARAAIRAMLGMKPSAG